MAFKAISWLIVAGGLSFSALGQNASRTAPVPGDPLELVTGQVQVVDNPASREAVLKLLARARNSYVLRDAGLGYDLRVGFTVNSGGQTEYDGAWQMEDVSDPKQGLRWTARAEAGFTTTQISSNGMLFREGTATTIPLRLHEARAALFGPMASAANVEHALIRTSEATYNGAQVTCVLLSGARSPATSTPGRRWEESEECIDPQSGLLQVHSLAPGRYYAYDYSSAPQLANRVLPRKITVTEAGKVVSVISVESLKELPAADASLFAPSAEMRTAGRATAMSGSQTISRVAGGGVFPAGATAQPVCVFGLVTSTGELIEAHSLQPSDPNSQAAVEAAKQINFSPQHPGARPQQHFVFVIEKFVARQ